MIKLISHAKRKCEFPKCKEFGRNKGSYKGQTRYGRFCQLHHRKMSKSGYYHDRSVIDNSKCENCGWAKAYCDRHRINPKLGYAKENVKSLCPNCHRLATVGLLKF